MDPNETLRLIREEIEHLKTATDVYEFCIGATVLKNRVEALDEWLSRGGFKPDAWEVKE